MKLATFRVGSNPEEKFGALVQDRILSFGVLKKRRGREEQTLHNMTAYLGNLPESERAAAELIHWAEENFSKLDNPEKYPLHEVKLLPPIPTPAGLIDFALTPRHLENSLKTLLRDEVACGVY